MASEAFSVRDEVSTCWCVSGVTSEQVRAHPVPSPERGGVARLCPHPGTLRNGPALSGHLAFVQGRSADHLWSKWSL